MSAARSRLRTVIVAGILVLLATSFVGLLNAQTPAQGQAQGTGARGGGRGIQAPAYPVLPIGSPFPDFSLLGIDNKRHSLRDYASANVLAVVFESVHCPMSIQYEARIRDLEKAYRSKGVTLIEINPNNPGAVRLNELGYTDMSDSLADMKARAVYRGMSIPYLYDGENQELSMKVGAVATPHIFIFDKERKLRYQGSIDDNVFLAQIKNHYAKDAIDALLAGKPVPVAETRAFGCSTKWLSKATGVQEEMAAIKAAPVTLDPIDAAALKTLRANAGTKTMLVNFWSLNCQTCVGQFPDFETTYRMYAGSRRPMDMVTISMDAPSRTAAVLDFLKAQNASGPNKQLASTDVAALQAAFGAKWNPSSAFTMVIAPGGQVLYQKEGRADIMQMRRFILAMMPDPAGPNGGTQAYWREAVGLPALAARP